MNRLDGSGFEPRSCPSLRRRDGTSKRRPEVVLVMMVPMVVYLGVDLRTRYGALIAPYNTRFLSTGEYAFFVPGIR
eukprot:2552145-Rhodomonas_salina.3